MLLSKNYHQAENIIMNMLVSKGGFMKTIIAISKRIGFFFTAGILLLTLGFLTDSQAVSANINLQPACYVSPLPMVVVSGQTLVANTIWSASNVYVIQGNVTVPIGVTLTIEADTIIKFTQSSNLNMDYSG